MRRTIPASALCLLIFANSLSTLVCDKHPSELSLILSGRSLDWPGQNTRSIYETSGRYVPRNVISTRMQIYKDDAIVAMPRYRSGVPFTLGVVSLRTKDCAPKVTPFPCWAIQEEGNCEALQSAVDIALDIQDILWVLDVGVVNTLEQTPVRRCPPKVVGIDVKSKKVVKVIDLSPLVNPLSRLQYLAVDYAEDGRVYMYVTDAATRSVIVYNVVEDRGYRVALPAVVTSGAQQQDVLYLALVKKSCGTSMLYLTYLGSNRLFAIEAVDLRRGSHGSVVDVGTKPQKIVLLGTDNGCAIFFRFKGEPDIYMWNTETSFSPDNFLLMQKGDDCRLPTQVVSGYRRIMWVIESNFHDYIENTVSCSGASVAIHPLVKTCEE